MPRPESQFPSYYKHPQQHSARCWLNGQWVALGRYDSPESRAEFSRICAEVATYGQLAVAARVGPRVVTTSELIAALKVHVECHHRRPDRTPTTDVKEYKGALRVVRELYGHTPAREFGPVALQPAVRRRGLGARHPGERRQLGGPAPAIPGLPGSAGSTVAGSRRGCRRRPAGRRPGPSGSAARASPRRT